MTLVAELPRAAAVYERIALGLEAPLAALGFGRGAKARFPWWAGEPIAVERVLVSAQVDSKATDPYSGGGFRLELEKAAQGAPNRKLGGRALFFQLLTHHQTLELLAQQNRIIAAGEPPPRSRVELYPEGDVREMYLSYFAPQEAFDAVHSWLRYRTLADVDSWATVLARLLEPLTRRAAELLHPASIHLGRGNLLPR